MVAAEFFTPTFTDCGIPVNGMVTTDNTSSSVLMAGGLCPERCDGRDIVSHWELYP